MSGAPKESEKGGGGGEAEEESQPERKGEKKEGGISNGDSSLFLSLSSLSLSRPTNVDYIEFP